MAQGFVGALPSCHPWLAASEDWFFGLRLQGERALPDHTTPYCRGPETQFSKLSPFSLLLLHNGVMRKYPIVLAAGFAISGAVLTAFSTPPYSLQMPGIVEHSKGVPVTVTVRAWNLRPREATITYLGDCCSLENSVKLPPFSTKTLQFTLNSEKLPAHSINKTASFSIKSGRDSFIKGVPYHVRTKKP